MSMSETFCAANASGVVTPDLVASFLQDVILEYESYKLQRSDPREPVSIPVEAVQLDEYFQPASAPFHMVTRDISCGGTGLFHTAAIESPYLQLQFCSPVNLETLKIIASVEQCSPCGVYFIIGCKFMTEAWGG